MRISMNPRYDSPGRFSLSPGRTSNGRSPLTPTEKADRSAAKALSAKVSWDCADTPPPLKGGLQLPQRLFAGRDDEDDGGSEERFELSPAVAAGSGREGFGSGSVGGSSSAGAWTLELSREEQEEENAGRVSAAGPLDDDDDGPKAKAKRLSLVSVVGAGTLSDDEGEGEGEEEEKEEGGEGVLVATDLGGQSGESPPSPEHAVAPTPAPDATPTTITPTVPAQKEADPPQQGAGVVEPVTETGSSTPPRPVSHDGDGDDAEQDSVLMNEIARMDEESILLEAESDLMGVEVAIDSDGDENDDATDGGDGYDDDDAEVTRKGLRGDAPTVDGADPDQAGGSRSSLDDSGYAPDAENTPWLVGVDDGDEAVAAEDGGERPEEESGLEDGNTAAVAAAEVATVAEATSSTDGQAGVDDDNDDDDGAVDASEDDEKSGYAPSGEEEEGGGGQGHRGLQRERQNTAGKTKDDAPAGTAAVVDDLAIIDSAVRETLENLTAGVAILVGDEQLLSCSEVLSELQSDAGDCGRAPENSNGCVEQAEEEETEPQEEDGPPRDDKEVGESQTGESSDALIHDSLGGKKREAIHWR